MSSSSSLSLAKDGLPKINAIADRDFLARTTKLSMEIRCRGTSLQALQSISIAISALWWLSSIIVACLLTVSEMQNAPLNSAIRPSPASPRPVLGKSPYAHAKETFANRACGATSRSRDLFPIQTAANGNSVGCLMVECSPLVLFKYMMIRPGTSLGLGMACWVVGGCIYTRSYPASLHRMHDAAPSW